MKARHEFGTPEQYYDYLRTYFASQAMVGICSGPDDGNYRVNGGWLHPETVALNAAQISDALLKELQK